MLHALLLLPVTLLGVAAGRPMRGVLCRVRRLFRFAFSTTARAAASAAVAALAASFSITLWLGPPAPAIQDEFSYLLAADTFAHGRLTNPPHPLWVHFESFHIIQQPTYASKYPPAEGMFLAIGEVVFGHPIVGTWLAQALAAAAVTWMLAAWLTPGWSLLGTLLLIARPFFSALWGDSFMGGTVPILGAALAFGGLPRLLRRPQLVDAISFAVGLLLLANSRPFEGFLASIPLLLLVVLARHRPPQRIILTASLILAAGFAWMAYYNYRVTGHVGQMPYGAYERQYSSAPLFSWQKARSRPAYRHELMRRFYEQRVDAMFYATSLSADRGEFRLSAIGSQVYAPFLSPLLVFPLVWSLFHLDRPARALTAALCLVLAGNLFSSWIWPHYFAPALPVLYLLTTLGLRRVFALGRSLSLGPALLITIGLSTLLDLNAQGEWLLGTRVAARVSWPGQRARILSLLRDHPRPDLVIVRYSESHDYHAEWVYNESDIDAAPVVFAREMDRASDRELMGYFADRCIWLLEPDGTAPRLRPHPDAPVSNHCLS